MAVRGRSRWLASVGLGVGVLALAGTGCGSSSSSSSSSSGGASAAALKPVPYTGFETQYPTSYPQPVRKPGFKFTLGFLNPVGANESQHYIQLGIQTETQLLGGTFIAKDDQLKVDKQVSDFDQLLAQKVNAIVVYPLDPKALGPELAKAKAAHVPVIALDVSFGQGSTTPPGYATQVRQERDQEAFEMAKTMSQALPGAPVGLIGFGQPVPSISFLMDRLRYWAAQDGLHVLGEQDNPTDDPAGGQSAMNGLLGKFPTMKGVIAYNDPSALGAVAAARGAGRQILAIGDNGGSDGLAGVRSGRLLATMQNDSVGGGAQAVIAAYDILTGQHMPLPPIISRPLKLVTKADINQIMTWPQQVAAMLAGH